MGAYQPASDANIQLSDVTTGNVSTSKHGFVPKATNVGNYLKDDGTWAAISASGGNWTAVQNGVFTMGSGGTGLTLTGLNGDVDRMYKLIIHTSNGSFNIGMFLAFNTFNGGDTTYTTYDDLFIGATSSPFSAVGTNAMRLTNNTSQLAHLEIDIYAASGGIRTARSAVQLYGSGGSAQSNASHFWTDTATNVTGLSFVDSVGHGSTGVFWLYKISP